MKDITVSELKALLSRYLRLASRGARIIVKDRDEPIAQMDPLEVPAVHWRDRLAAAGRLRRGSQDWGSLGISPLDRWVDIQGALADVREDAVEVRRR
jgi:antitoxin (DNA-binding transcriptional repressor) of toxin-antitoxin stability system